MVMVTIILVDDNNGHIHLCGQKGLPSTETSFLSYLRGPFPGLEMETRCPIKWDGGTLNFNGSRAKEIASLVVVVSGDNQ